MNHCSREFVKTVKNIEKIVIIKSGIVGIHRLVPRTFFLHLKRSKKTLHAAQEVRLIQLYLSSLLKAALK